MDRQSKNKAVQRKIIAVDFDGTLCENKWPEIGEANMQLIWHLTEQREKYGARLILWTCRVGDKLIEALEWCRLRGLIFDAVNENLPDVIEWMGGDTRKIYADEYIDDRAVGILPYIGKETVEKLADNKWISAEGNTIFK